MTNTVADLSILVNCHGNGRYKSIQSDVEWRDVPPLAVLTGLNGSGKPQLLELIAHRLIGTPLSHESPDSQIITVDISPVDSLTEADVAYIPSRWDFPGSAGI